MTTFADICVSVFRVPKQRRNKAPPSTFKKVASEIGRRFAKCRRPGLQRYVRKSLGDVDMLVWIARGLKEAGRVCRVEKDRNALGTGFLVGPDYVLTNWHVVRNMLPGNNTDDLACRFDFAADPGGGTSSGEEIDVARSGIIAFSPCSAAELTAVPDVPPPNANELDYALLRLSSQAGTSRGWMDLRRDAEKPAANAPILIVQHPAAAPLKLAMDAEAVIGDVFGGLRLRYRTNTDHGSSGAHLPGDGLEPGGIAPSRRPCPGAAGFEPGRPHRVDPG